MVQLYTLNPSWLSQSMMCGHSQDSSFESQFNLRKTLDLEVEPVFHLKIYHFVSMEEQLKAFLFITGHNNSNRKAQDLAKPFQNNSIRQWLLARDKM
ncbi:hypothetical protein VP01_2263g5 [Puccinia sorghi]|uniref:Uncharacterized protein n=1 Tax=Puccinia sorghi TaxID=27349 RepID=A0A0L6V906_9BASI|nr:hypothetical protein VP01_2263g5 [Puccinia sorghi]